MGAQLDTWQLVEAPAVVPQPYGIFSVAEPRLATDEHWRLGIRWQSQACAEAKVTTGACIEPRETPLTPDDYCYTVEFEPFTVYAYDNDDIPGHTLAEHQAQAIQRLVNGEQKAVESQVWANIGTDAGAPVDLSGYDIRFALGFVEQQIAQNYGGTGVIHVNHLVATVLWDAFVVQGGRLTTIHGTPVVVGSGYDLATDPLARLGYIYGTGAMVIYRGDIDTRESAINKPINQVSYIAQRDYVVGWDCYSVAVKATTDPS